jgi:hypothetical protein
MRFWLRRAIVTVPVIVCVSLWMRSYWIEDLLERGSYHCELVLTLHRGSLGFVLSRDQQWTLRGGRWGYQQFSAGKFRDDFTQTRFLGFGYEKTPGPGAASGMILEVPAWFLTLLSAAPATWMYRRDRKRRKVGFPVEPSPTNSTR